MFKCFNSKKGELWISCLNEIFDSFEIPFFGLILSQIKNQLFL
jgi:hypothetical protein